jgi:O-antigen/teichoic acid export membrane protein
MLCLPLYFKQTLNLAINLLVIVALVKFNYTIILLLKYSTISIHTRLIKEFMVKVMPFMFSILLGGSMEYINSYIVKYKFSEIDFAVFRYGAKELPIFLILANSLSNIYSGEIANLNKDGLLKDGLAKLRQSSKKLMYWLFPLSILLLFVSKYMYVGLYNSDLVEGYKIFNISLLLIISRLIFPQTVLTGLIKTRAFYLVSTNVLIVNVVLAVWFVELLGISGIAYATVISFLVEKIQLVIYCKMEGIKFKEYTPVKEFFTFSAMLLVAFAISLVVL